METTKKDCYIYVFLNNMKSGNYKYEKYNLSFEFEPYYIGKSSHSTYHNREEVHIRYALNGKDVCNNFHKMNTINKLVKNGFDPIVIRIFDNLTEDDANLLESKLIEEIGTRINKNGPLVNIAKGGLGGDTFTNNPRKEEIREKHRQNALGSKNNMYGRKLEDSPSHIAKLNGKHWNKGRKASEETLIKLSEINSGHKNNASKKTLLFDGELNLIKEYECCKYLAQDIGAKRSTCSKTARTNAIKNNPYHTTKGYIIIYKTDWDSKFSNRVKEIKEFLKTHVKNKNQFS
jgi:hypothetical protein